jgi:hypothetical protein
MRVPVGLDIGGFRMEVAPVGLAGRSLDTGTYQAADVCIWQTFIRLFESTG